MKLRLKVLLAHNGLPSNAVRELLKISRLRLGDGLADRAVKSRRLSVSDDLTNEDEDWLELLVSSGFQSAISLPLKSGDKVVGVISGFSRQQRILNVEDLEMLTSLGNMVGMAIVNARLSRLSGHPTPPEG